MQDNMLDYITAWAKGLLLGPPIWVWILLVYLVYSGVRSFKTRNVPIFVFYITPCLGFLSIRSISTLHHSSIAWSVFGVIYILSAIGFFRWQKHKVLERSKTHVVIKGEWVSLVCFMVIFWANFVHGVLTVISPATYQSVGFVVIFSALLGTVSGSFIGRPLCNILITPISDEDRSKLVDIEN